MRVRLGWFLALGLVVLMTSTAHAEGALDVALGLRGVPLGAQMAVLEDPSGKLTVDQVAQRGALFRKTGQDAPTFGFTDSVYWVRLPVQNTAQSRRAWLLEVAFPHLDDLTLFLPRPDGGFVMRQTGDSRPFDQRDLAYRNFVFTLEEPPDTEVVYYLRIQTGGSMNLPLVAWTLEEFVEHQHLHWAGLCIFYGVILVMTCYNACLYVFTRQAEYSRFAWAALSMGFFQMTYVGHGFQFLLPNHSALAQQAIPISIGLCMFFSARLGQHQLFVGSRVPLLSRRLMEGVVWLCLALTVLGALTPMGFALRLMPISCVLINLFVCVVGLRVAPMDTIAARANIVGWGCLITGALVLGLTYAHVLPSNLFTDWSVQIGASAQFVLLSSAMSTKLNTLRTELAELNARLSQKVTALEHAVMRAEQASTIAEQATRVKDQFIATMSHELRTPLNTIINIPQGLVEDFPISPRLRCAECQSQFELEPDEQVGADTRCPECQAVGGLAAFDAVHYTGQPAKTLRYLEKIERSGTHLLHVVDGMLRADQLQSDEVPLALERVDLAPLVRDVIEEMSDLSERAGVSLSLASSLASLELSLDPLRIRQVLINLIGNAIKFSSAEGRVRILLAKDAESGLCSVQDEGIGIPADKLESVFDSYRQADSDVSKHYGGTGLGLAIARSLVRAHGGELWAESTVGHGSTFHIRLPRAQRQRQSA